MEQNNNNEDPQESVSSLTEILTSFGADEHNEINPLQGIFGAHDSSSWDVTENSDQTLDEDGDVEISYRMTKRERRMEYRMMMENKRRRIISEKVDILQGMMHLNTKADLGTKIDNIIVHLKLLVQKRDVLAMAYKANLVYNAQTYYGAQAQCYGAQAPCYGTQTPYMSPWGCYAQGIPIMPQQNMPYIPQYDQVHNTAQPEQTKAQPEQAKPSY